MYSNLLFKRGVDSTQLSELHPALLIVLGFIALYCKEHDLQCVITSIKDDAPGRKSKTHEEGRAIDFSVRGIPRLHQRRLEHQLNTRYGTELGTAPEGKPWRVIVIHDAGSGSHIHAQVRRDALISWIRS